MLLYRKTAIAFLAAQKCLFRKRKEIKNCFKLGLLMRSQKRLEFRKKTR